MARLSLPTVTLCAATSVNVAATVKALQHCLDQADFAHCLLFTHAEPADLPSGIQWVPIAPLKTAAAYSQFVLRSLAEHIATEHCLIVQWDGFVLDASRWRPEFLRFDYIGAPWPQFTDGHDVGNGGFSLRSRRLLRACLRPAFVASHPEDVAICRRNRDFLERELGMLFADRETAQQFSFERTIPSAPAFGFHGIFNLVPVLGAEAFWRLYRTLDDRSSIIPDFGLIWRQLGRGRHGHRRRLIMLKDALAELVRAARPRPA